MIDEKSVNPLPNIEHCFDKYKCGSVFFFCLIGNQYQKTNGPESAHLRSDHRAVIGQEMTLTVNTHSVSCLYLPTFKSQATVSEKSIVFHFFTM